MFPPVSHPPLPPPQPCIWAVRHRQLSPIPVAAAISSATRVPCPTIGILPHFYVLLVACCRGGTHKDSTAPSAAPFPSTSGRRLAALVEATTAALAGWVQSTPPSCPPYEVPRAWPCRCTTGRW